jgi:hypothetical protein
MAENDFSNSGKWWNDNWHFRIPVQTLDICSEAKDFPIKVNINFTKLLKLIGKKGVFDENSLRVIPLKSNKTIACKWHPDRAYDAAGNACGTLVWHSLDKNKLYYIYFDIIENGPKNAISVQGILPSDNLIKNPGFEKWDENSPLFWSKCGKSLFRDRSSKQQGDSAIRITKGGVFSEKIPINQADCIKASVYVKIAPELGENIKGKAMMHLVAFSDEKKFIANVRGVALDQESPAWKKMDIICSLPPGTAYIAVHLFVLGKNVNAWFDNTVVKQINIKEAKQIECIDDIASNARPAVDGCLNIAIDKSYYEIRDKYAFIKITSFPQAPFDPNKCSLKIELFKEGKMLRTKTAEDIKREIIPFEISSLSEGDYVFRVSLLDPDMKILCSGMCSFNKLRGPFDRPDIEPEIN